MSTAAAWAGRLRGYAAVGLAVAGVSVVTTASAQTEPPTADMAVRSIRSSASIASPGAIVAVTEVIRNNGPDPVEMDTSPKISGGVLVGETCADGISPDTPFCEYGIVSPGASLTTRFQVKITASGGRLVIKGGVTSESALQDSNPFNQYQVATVTIS